MAGIDLAISRLKLVPTRAKVNNKVTPSPKDIIVIGVMLFACVIFFTDVLREILELV